MAENIQTQITDLPNELLQKIFQFTQNPKDWENFGLACRRFGDITTTEFLHFPYVKLDMFDNIEKCNSCDTFVKMKPWKISRLEMHFGQTKTEDSYYINTMVDSVEILYELEIVFKKRPLHPFPMYFF